MAEKICEITAEIAETKGKILAVDGKAIRSTSKKRHPHSCLQILTAYATESGIILGQKTIHEKTNEIPVFQEMLDTLNIEGLTVTADAMHCQKDTCSKIIEKKGNYLFGLKTNQKNLYEDVSLFLEDETNHKDFDTFQTVEKNGGRIEKRLCRKTNDISWLPDLKKNWSGLKSIFSIKRTVTTRQGVSEETGYYISSLDTTAKELSQIARDHQKIESMHGC